MEKIFSINPEWEQIMKRHADKCNDLQQVVNELTENGLTVTFGDIKDLINNGSALYQQVEQTVKSNAGIFKLPAAKAKFITENTEILQNVIDEAKKEINRILAVNSIRPLSFDAYEIRKGMVAISDAWVQNLKESHTLRMTSEREKALELIQNVEVAIEQLNQLVKDNKFFGTGITTSQDSRRSLMWLSGDGVIHINIDELEFI